MTMRKIIRTEGPHLRLDRIFSMRELRALIGAETVDVVRLPILGEPLQVMLVDDAGHEKGLPVNAYATSLYLMHCHAGATHQIRGDVAIVPDRDFEGRP